jgi:glycosyltransferase involved in cell wall biosynthesis
MKILYLCNEYPPAPHGGIGTFVKTLAHAVAAAGHDVTVLGLGDAGAERMDGPVRVVTLPRLRLRIVGALVDRWRIYRWIARAARAGNVDLIEVPDYEGLLPLRVGWPVVVRLHNTATAIDRHRGRKPSVGVWLFERLTLRANQNWIAVSRFIADVTVRTFGVRPARSRVIYHPVAGPGNGEAEELPAETPRRFVLYAGSVSRQKGVLTLAEAARSFLAQDPGLHLLFVGHIATHDTPAADEGIRSIVGPALANRVHFPGRVTRGRVLAYMRRAALFVLPSTFESFSLAVVEAMHMGTPVVVFDAGPFPEYVTHTETGMLVPAGDADALAAAIERVLADAALHSRLASAARALAAARFTTDRCVRESLDFYADCIRARGRPSPGYA